LDIKSFDIIAAFMNRERKKKHEDKRMDGKRRYQPITLLMRISQSLCANFCVCISSFYHFLKTLQCMKNPGAGLAVPHPVFSGGLTSIFSIGLSFLPTTLPTIASRSKASYLLIFLTSFSDSRLLTFDF